MDVRTMASLAKLRIPDRQLEELSRDMDAIIEMVKQLPSEDEGHLSEEDVFMMLREDFVKPSLPREDLLQNAPSVAGEYFKVPKALE